MKRSTVYVFSYACDPGAGSEPGTGWTWLAAVLEHNDVRLFTDAHNPLEQVRASAESLPGRLEIELVPGGWSSRISVGSRLRHIRYMLWVRRAGRLARTLEASEGPTVAHHITYAADWLPSPAAWLRVTPFIWGPVGGATYPSFALLLALPVRVFASEILRSASTRLARRAFCRRTIKRAELAVAMNEDSRCMLQKLRRNQKVVVEPNVAIDTATLPSLRPRSGQAKTAVFAGRLIPWKGASIAIRALQRTPGWHLSLFGDGPQLPGLQRLAHRLGIDKRIRFHGRVERYRVLDALASADALLFPSLHDANSWAVAEAVTMGLPVVCLDIGGPPFLAGPLGVPVTTNRRVVRSLSHALMRLPQRGTPYHRWDARRLPDVLQSWYSTGKLSSAD